jgi:hypothetical protein
LLLDVTVQRARWSVGPVVVDGCAAVISLLPRRSRS